jgi:Uncharacterized protein conserved in bacteria (DUF2252)
LTGAATPSERAAKGKAAREQARRSGHSALPLSEGRDPIALLESQARSRVSELVPLRYGRMLVSPLAFFRGAATVMAHDLASTPAAGLRVQLSGDAHLLNFGGFASPERDLVFDLNDFDETFPGPFEWDVKRLATSFEIAGRDRGLPAAERRRAVLAVLHSYRESMRRFAGLGELDVWYARLDARVIDEQLQARGRKLEKRVRRSEEKAYAHDRMRALAKLTTMSDGEPRFLSDPPLIVPLSELDGRDGQIRLEPSLDELIRDYGRTLPDDVQALLARYRHADLARKVVGVGSVGTRCWVMLLLGRDERDPLFLQIKEAQHSVLEPVLEPAGSATQGERVVEGQRLIQAASDIFLGWLHADEDLGGARDFYVRQLWDWKISVDVGTIEPSGLIAYAAACGWTLARAHARSGDRIALAAYLGAGDRFDRAVAEFARAYADLNERDHGELVRAVAQRRVVALEGV